MKLRWVSLCLTLAFVPGCASPHIRPDVKIKRGFEVVDTIEFGDIRVSNPETISHLRDIHARTKWDPVPTTMPLDIVAIYGIADGEERFKLLYGAGWLMDTQRGVVVRMGKLNEEDRDWIHENIRLKLPPNPGII